MIAMQKSKRNLTIAAEFGHAATHSTHMAIIKPGSLGPSPRHLHLVENQKLEQGGDRGSSLELRF
jgi:hypothetical protein